MAALKTEIDALIFVNNAISVSLVKKALDRDGIPVSKVALILGRDVAVEWADQCRLVLAYGGRAAQDFLGQWRFLGFYIRGRRLLAQVLKVGLQRIYVVNNDNLLSNALFVWRERFPAKIPPITVIAEGIMNYQQITVVDRARWRWRSKRILAALLGMPYRIPDGHLSGAFEPGTDRVISFSAIGLKAPPERILVIPYAVLEPAVSAAVNACLIVHTGLWQWMDADKYERFARAFADWVIAQGFSKVLTKSHPHVPVGLLSKLLPDHEVLQDDRSVEALAAEIPAGTVMGTCCTALATLKLIRPDLRCVDYGADYYCRYAYHGDFSVVDFLRGCGVEIVDSGLG